MFKGFFDHDLQWLHEAHIKYKWNLQILYTEFVQIALFS